MLIKVKVKTKAKQNTLVELSDDTFVAEVTAVRKEGEANKAVTRLLQEKFSGKRVLLVSGARKPHKIYEILEEEKR